MQAVLTFVQKFWIPIKQLFGFLSQAEEAVKPLVSLPSTATPVQTRQEQESILKTYYDNAKDPGVTFRIFLLRVTHFDWNMKEALLSTEGDMRYTQINGKLYTASEIYNACNNPAVSYATFQRRVNVHGWGALKALTHIVSTTKMVEAK